MVQAFTLEREHLPSPQKHTFIISTPAILGLQGYPARKDWIPDQGWDGPQWQTWHTVKDVLGISILYRKSNILIRQAHHYSMPGILDRIKEMENRGQGLQPIQGEGVIRPRLCAARETVGVSGVTTLSINPSLGLLQLLNDDSYLALPTSCPVLTLCLVWVFP